EQEMRDIMDRMEASSAEAGFVSFECESRSHREHFGELAQCSECLRLVCAAEEAGEGLCNECAVRVGMPVMAFA
ncbi:hypothetical protein, partial [Streptomyces galilaeus]|uniref:hypothetical protein n=1 Tax=Streptomyces galilaeus TaxID=33899 RepID=UPI0038F70F36